MLSNAYFEFIFLQNFVLIQPRTSPPKICKFSKNAFSKNAFSKNAFRKMHFRKMRFRKMHFRKMHFRNIGRPPAADLPGSVQRPPSGLPIRARNDGRGQAGRPNSGGLVLGPRRPVGVRVRVSKIGKIGKILQIFGGLVLGCIKTKFCKKICVRQHFSSSTRFAHLCTAPNPKCSRMSIDLPA